MAFHRLRPEKTRPIEIEADKLQFLTGAERTSKPARLRYEGTDNLGDSRKPTGRAIATEKLESRLQGTFWHFNMQCLNPNPGRMY